MRPSLVQCLAATWLATAPASAATSSGDPHGWSRLRLEHAGFALDATLDITRDEQAAASLPTGNITGHEALGASGATVGQLVMNSEFRLSPLFQRHRRSVLWFDPADHAALWSTRETTGAGAGYRSVRYAAGGLELLRATPATSAERKAAPSTWSTRERSLVDYGTAGQHCNAVTEASVLLLLDPGSLPEGLCIVSKQRLLRPVFSPAEAADVALDVLAHHADGTSTTLRYTDARRYALRLEPVDGGDDDDREEAFLGLRGEIVVLTDAATATPLRLRGTAGFAGKVDFTLREIWLVDD